MKTAKDIVRKYAVIALFPPDHFDHMGRNILGDRFWGHPGERVDP